MRGARHSPLLRRCTRQKTGARRAAAVLRRRCVAPPRASHCDHTSLPLAALCRRRHARRGGARCRTGTRTFIFEKRCSACVCVCVLNPVLFFKKNKRPPAVSHLSPPPPSPLALKNQSPFCPCTGPPTRPPGPAPRPPVTAGAAVTGARREAALGISAARTEGMEAPYAPGDGWRRCTR